MAYPQSLNYGQILDQILDLVSDMDSSVGQELEVVCTRLSGSKSKDFKVGSGAFPTIALPGMPGAESTKAAAQDALKRLSFLLDSPALLQHLDTQTLCWQHESGQKLPGEPGGSRGMPEPELTGHIAEFCCGHSCDVARAGPMPVHNIQERNTSQPKQS